MNLGINSITALGHNTAQILKINEVKHLCRQLLKEGHQVAEASGIQFPHTIVDDIMQIYAGYPDHMGKYVLRYNQSSAIRSRSNTRIYL